MHPLPDHDRLAVVVASQAPIAVVIRTGPKFWSQLIKWDLTSDSFEPGQWLIGTVDHASLSPSGEHIALGITGAKSRAKCHDDTQYTLVSRPPFFTALAICIRPLLVNGIDFTSDGKLNWVEKDKVDFRAQNECPYEMVTIRPQYMPYPDSGPLTGSDYNRFLSNDLGLEAIKRDVYVRDGKIFEGSEDDERVLFDSQQYQPCEVKTPDWALTW